MSAIDAARLAEAVVRWLEKPGNYIDVGKWDASEYRESNDHSGWTSWMQEIIDEYEAIDDPSVVRTVVSADPE